MYAYDYEEAIQDAIDSAGCNLTELVARAEINDLTLRERLAWIALRSVPGVLTAPTLVW